MRISKLKSYLMQIHAPKQLSKCSNPSAKSNFGAERVMTRNIVTVEEISA